MKPLAALVAKIETYISDYVTLADPQYSLPIALWLIGTFCFPEFDAYPYLVITAPVKRSGKTRLAEMMSFCCSNPRNFAAMTGPTLFQCIEAEAPTIFFDEAESLSSEAAGNMRSVLNVGYRKGQTIPRTAGRTAIREFKTYCPKVFILIGDVFDTLKDRSIIITMKRAEPKMRFTYDAAKDRGADLREEISDTVKANLANIANAFAEHEGLPFLQDRDEEIWTSLFVLCGIFCRERIVELQRSASDMAVEKTAEARRYIDLTQEEDKARDDEYAKRLLLDLYGLLATNGKVITTANALEALKAIPTAPWRKFRGTGLDVHDLANLLSRFGVQPKKIRIGYGRKDSKSLRGYTLKAVAEALTHIK